MSFGVSGEEDLVLLSTDFTIQEMDKRVEEFCNNHPKNKQISKEEAFNLCQKELTKLYAGLIGKKINSRAEMEKLPLFEGFIDDQDDWMFRIAVSPI